MFSCPFFRRPPVSLLFTSLLALPSLLRAAPVISEFHFHPQHAALSPEPVTQEWVEIHNPDAVLVDVGGWQFTSGVDFTIPAGTSIPAGGHLVVAANVPSFMAAYPGFSGAMTGGWTGQLSNSGEKLTLKDAAGVEVDTVDYADEGDWAIRSRGALVSAWLGHQGWDWFTNADALGRTKELVRPALKKNTGQNWADSTVSGGTPGAVNSVNTANVAPVILAAQTPSPSLPKSWTTTRRRFLPPCAGGWTGRPRLRRCRCLTPMAMENGPPSSRRRRTSLL
jgi:hypothetical protein